MVVFELDILFEFDRGLENRALGGASYLEVVEHVDGLLFGLYLRRSARRVLFPVDLCRVEVSVLLGLRVWLELRLLPLVLAVFSLPVIRRVWSEEFALPAGGENLQLRGSIEVHSATSALVVDRRLESHRRCSLSHRLDLCEQVLLRRTGWVS